VTPSVVQKSVTAPVGAARSLLSPTVQATYTGGAPGTPTYAWEFVSQNAGTFENPVNASSMVIRRTDNCFNQQEDVTFKCKVTDALGNFSYTEVATAQFQYNNFS
jgi:hypothetical protein